jgi:hypothetical protein
MASIQNLTTFEIIAPGAGRRLSGIMPATAKPIGTPLMIASVDNDTGEPTFAVADKKCDGWLDRELSATSGNSLEWHMLGRVPDAGEIVTPYVINGRGSIVDADELIIEDLVSGGVIIKTSSTGAISSSTNANTPLSFDAGQLYVAQSTDFCQYEMIDAGLTPNTATTYFRIRIKKVPGYYVS